MNYILGGCQIDATGLESAGSFNLISKVITTKLIKEILKNEGKESVWQLWQKQNGEHKSTSFDWFGLCFTNSRETEFVLAVWTSLHGMAVKTMIYADNMTAIYFILQKLFKTQRQIYYKVDATGLQSFTNCFSNWAFSEVLNLQWLMPIINWKVLKSEMNLRLSPIANRYYLLQFEQMPFTTIFTFSGKKLQGRFIIGTEIWLNAPLFQIAVPNPSGSALSRFRQVSCKPGFAWLLASRFLIRVSC